MPATVVPIERQQSRLIPDKIKINIPFPDKFKLNPGVSRLNKQNRVLLPGILTSVFEDIFITKRSSLDVRIPDTCRNSRKFDASLSRFFFFLGSRYLGTILIRRDQQFWDLVVEREETRVRQCIIIAVSAKQA